MQEIRLGNFSLILGRNIMLHVRMEGALYTRTRDMFEPTAALGQSPLAKHME
ncbi:hypothetical protein [Bradyrhizobium sp. NAS80.1]|uniref:hypothetical protein n=1 Tax=Bradyrhizobium sp. NAS80.1 TaxID=1680159 RepID=UPI001AEF76CF|nr:hypothetical protein [Bradyrhizobium sp. NAS80.1]